MRHKRRGRHLGRTSSHRKALMRNLAASLLLTERDPEYYEGMFQADGKTEVNPPKFRGRIVTTLHKAKEVRPLIEKCITIAKKALPHAEKAEEFATDEDRNSDGWSQWRKSENWRKWAEARAPVVNARRRVFSMLRDKEAVEILFDEVAPRFTDREGGYTRIMKLAMPRLGDAGVQAILEFVGQNDKVKRTSTKPVFDASDSGDTKDE
ncbi:MAG: L17 family ribosomal protein, partial [Planctomycetota bacterium]